MIRPVSLFVEGFAGTAALTWALLSSRRPRPPWAYMGGKWRLTPDILAALGLTPGQGAVEIVLIDAGPCGRAWQALHNRRMRRAICRILRSWQGKDPVKLWDDLSRLRPDERGLAWEVAQWLWLQARSANACPVWFDEARGWRMGDAPNRREKQTAIVQRGVERSLLDARARGGEAAPMVGQPLGGGSHVGGRSRVGGQPLGPKSCGYSTQADQSIVRGMIHPATIAERIEVIGLLMDRHLLTVIHGGAAALLSLNLRGAVVYLDPPYAECTGYALDCPRPEVYSIALPAVAAGACVAISEAVPLDLDGWHPIRLAHREFLTLSEAPYGQLPLLEVA